ncbi:hypothetical protein DFH07DRAFT_763602 [Mycena maculata]|uniref:Uncharacterized protein n=1 Tax=Mycena maculata TaxID=230809 RepID=A0AAD7KHU4_9AGAR|nr:hypothetical protein DFH07DRAFT_763602 [Mycena maculata]
MIGARAGAGRTSVHRSWRPVWLSHAQCVARSVSGVLGIRSSDPSPSREATLDRMGRGRRHALWLGRIPREEDGKRKEDGKMSADEDDDLDLEEEGVMGSSSTSGASLSLTFSLPTFSSSSPSRLSGVPPRRAREIAAAGERRSGRFSLRTLDLVDPRSAKTRFSVAQPEPVGDVEYQPQPQHSGCASFAGCWIFADRGAVDSLTAKFLHRKFQDVDGTGPSTAYGGKIMINAWLLVSTSPNLLSDVPRLHSANTDDTLEERLPDPAGRLRYESKCGAPTMLIHVENSPTKLRGDSGRRPGIDESSSSGAFLFRAGRLKEPGVCIASAGARGSATVAQQVHREGEFWQRRPTLTESNAHDSALIIRCPRKQELNTAWSHIIVGEITSRDDLGLRMTQWLQFKRGLANVKSPWAVIEVMGRPKLTVNYYSKGTSRISVNEVRKAPVVEHWHRFSVLTGASKGSGSKGTHFWFLLHQLIQRIVSTQYKIARRVWNKELRKISRHAKWGLLISVLKLQIKGQLLEAVEHKYCRSDTMILHPDVPPTYCH